MKPRLLDLFCGAGGAAMGYQRAGFEVVGIDHVDQPNYPFEFIQADAFEFLHEEDVESAFDAIHASPPCQAFTQLRVIHGLDHPDLLTPTRQRLRDWGECWVIENVPGAPMRSDLILCGSTFPELKVRKHRLFEFGFPFASLMSPCDHSRPAVPVWGHGGFPFLGLNAWKDAMQIDWMTQREMSQAIPPVYTEHIGHYLLAEINARVAA